MPRSSNNKGHDIVSDCDPDHNHGGDKESALAHLAVNVAFHQCIAVSQIAIPKRYRELKVRVQFAVDRYMSSEILVYLRAIVHLSHC